MSRRYLVGQRFDIYGLFVQHHRFGKAARLIHHSDRGVQRASIRPAESLAEAGIKSTVGGVGDSRNNALVNLWLDSNRVCKTTHHEQRGDHQTAGA